MSASEDRSSWSRVPVNHVTAFIKRCVEAAGGATDQAEALAEVLTIADARGHYSHGLNRLELYIGDLMKGFVTKSGKPTILKETGATAWVKGNKLLGPTVGKFCMELAIKKAKDIGIGMVVAKDSNHYGIAGWYALMAKDQGMIGVSLTNTSPVVVPTRATKPHVGTNPISMAAPAGPNDSFVLDMATSTVALGKVEIAQRKEISIPDSWGCDGQGMSTSNPNVLLGEGGLFALGGQEESGGYKGYGLSFMVDILCGVLGGATYGPYVRQWVNKNGGTGQSGDLGHCFIAINPEMFAPNFEDRLTDFISTTRDLPPSNKDKPVLIAGDPERIHEKECMERGGILYHPNFIKAMNELAEELKVEPIIQK